MSETTKVAVIGAGISGLLAAYYLQKKNKNFVVFEASPRVGGWIHSERDEDVLFEWGPHTLMAGREWFEIFDDLELRPELPRPVSKYRYIWKDGRRVRLPTNPAALFGTDLFSGGAKRQLISGLFRRVSIEENDLSIADFFRRIFHEDVIRYAIDPFVGGVFAGDANKISAAASFSRIWDHIKSGKPLINLFFGGRRGGRRKLVSFSNGLGEIAQSLAQRFEHHIKTGHAINRIEKLQDKWRLHFNEGSELFDHIILACPSHVAAGLLEGHLEAESLNFLREVLYRRVGVWNVVFERPANFETGFGCLIPRSENEKMLGSLWPSEMFSGRGYPEKLVAAQYFAGSSVPSRPEDHLRLLQSVLGVSEEPLKSRWKVHENAIPQFQLGHRERVKALRARIPSKISVVGNYLDGVGLSDVRGTAEKEVESIK